MTLVERHPTVGYVTLQFHVGGLFDSEPVDDMIHLVRSAGRHGTPGPTLCGIDRFAPGTPGWSVGGGVTGPDRTHRPCPECVEAADPALTVTGTFAAVFRSSSTTGRGR